jgi:hypothetical protein
MKRFLEKWNKKWLAFEDWWDELPDSIASLLLMLTVFSCIALFILFIFWAGIWSWSIVLFLFFWALFYAMVREF